jgi:hypothetical protein
MGYRRLSRRLAQMNADQEIWAANEREKTRIRILGCGESLKMFVSQSELIFKSIRSQFEKVVFAG